MSHWRLSLCMLLFLALLGFSGEVDAEDPEFDFRFDNPNDGNGTVDPENIIELSVEIENLITEPRDFELVITNNNDLQNNGLNAWWSHNGQHSLTSKSTNLSSIDVAAEAIVEGIVVSIEATEYALYGEYNIDLRCRDNDEPDPETTKQHIQLTVNVNEKAGVSLQLTEGGEAIGSVDIDGETAYQIQINNNGNRQDTISLAISSNDWDSSFSESTVTIDPFSDKIVTLIINSDNDVNYGDSDELTITATSGNSNDATDTLNLQTYVRVQYGLEVEVITQSLSRQPGDTVVFDFLISNKWSESVSYEIVCKDWYRGTPGNRPEGWSYSEVSGTLDAFEELTTSSFDVVISSGADAGEVVTIIVQAKVSGDNDNVGVIERVIEVHVEGNYEVALLLPQSDQIDLDVGQTISLSKYVLLKNLANVNDWVTITAVFEYGGDGWVVNIPEPMVMVASEEKSIFISVQAPESAAGSQAILKISAQSGGDPDKYDDVTISFTVGGPYNEIIPETETPLYDVNKTSTNDSGGAEIPSLTFLTALISIGLIAIFRRK